MHFTALLLRGLHLQEAALWGRVHKRPLSLGPFLILEVSSLQLLPFGLFWALGLSLSWPPAWKPSLSFEVQIHSGSLCDRPGQFPYLMRSDGFSSLVPQPTRPPP